jgi:predicted HD phosphohydrolase
MTELLVRGDDRPPPGLPVSVTDIVALFEERGSWLQGTDPVTPLEHALQCASLAERGGASPMLVAAALLHDLGRLVMDGSGQNENAGDDHHCIALSVLRGLLPDPVLEPIRLHVEAKRYLCRADPDYWRALSPASRAGLEDQGGIFTAREAATFASRPFAADATRLRKWDDLAKRPGTITQPLAHFEAVLRRVTLR